MDIQALQFMERILKAPDKFDYFDYVDFFEALDEDVKVENPKKWKIVSEFIRKCEEKLELKKKNQNAWKNFLQRASAFEKYKQEKNEAMKFIKEHYDNRNEQLLFYPKVSKRKATQKGKAWKDSEPCLEDQEHIEEQERILKPNQSTFITYSLNEN